MKSYHEIEAILNLDLGSRMFVYFAIISTNSLHFLDYTKFSINPKMFLQFFTVIISKIFIYMLVNKCLVIETTVVMISMPQISYINIIFFFPVLIFFNLKMDLPGISGYLVILCFNVIPFIVYWTLFKKDFTTELASLTYVGDYFYIH